MEARKSGRDRVARNFRRAFPIIHVILINYPKGIRRKLHRAPSPRIYGARLIYKFNFRTGGILLKTGKNDTGRQDIADDGVAFQR